MNTTEALQVAVEELEEVAYEAENNDQREYAEELKRLIARLQGSTMTRHTPGPWYALSGPSDRTIISNRITSEHSKDEHYIGLVNDRDARLMAAAPDLYRLAFWAYKLLALYVQGNEVEDTLTELGKLLDAIEQDVT